jgi:hypothetical protein
MGHVIELIDGDYAVCKLPPTDPIPHWANTPFCVFLRSTDELAVLCEQKLIPSGVQCEAGWKLLKLRGPFEFTAVGVLASILDPLAKSNISILSYSAFDTDYVLVKREQLPRTCLVLEQAGHTVEE